jgi:hypothetical protein
MFTVVSLCSDYQNGNNYPVEGGTFATPHGAGPNLFSPGKMSTISSEDIEMAGKQNIFCFLLQIVHKTALAYQY